MLLRHQSPLICQGKGAPRSCSSAYVEIFACDTFQCAVFHFVSPFKCHLKQFDHRAECEIGVFSRCFSIPFTHSNLVLSRVCFESILSFPQKVVPDQPMAVRAEGGMRVPPLVIHLGVLLVMTCSLRGFYTSFLFCCPLRSLRLLPLSCSSLPAAPLPPFPALCLRFCFVPS